MIRASDRLNFYGLLVLIVLASVVRLAVIDSQGLWADELFSVAIATGHSLEHPSEMTDPAQGDFYQGDSPRTASEWRRYLEYDPDLGGIDAVVRATRLSDTSPPLYYVLLHYWIWLLGNSDRALKGFSILCSILAIPILARIARIVAGSRAVLPTCAFFAFSPASLYYSTEGRMYSLGWLCAVLAGLATLQWRMGGKRTLAPLIWVVASAAGFYTHYFFSFVWAVFVFWLLVYPGRTRRGYVLIASALVILSLLPWYASLGKHMSAWRITSGWLEMRPRNWNLYEAIWSGLFGHLSGRGIWGGGYKSNLIAMALFALCLGTFLVRWKARAFLGYRAWMGMWLLAPLGGVLLLDAWHGTYGLANYRYVSLGLPAAALIAGTALGQWRAPLSWTALLLIILSWTPRMMNLYESSSRIWSPYREVGEEISAQVEMDGLVIAQSIPSGVLGIARYSRSDLQIAAWVERLDEREDGDLEKMIEGREQVILVRAHEVWPNDRVETLLRESAGFTGDYRRGSIRVLEFDPNKELSPSAGSADDARP